MREGCVPLALSRGCSGGEFGFRRCRGCPFDGVRFRQCGGCPFDDVRFRQCRAVLLTAFVSDDAGIAFLRFFFPDGASVGRSAPLHPIGDGVREGCDPLALSRGWSGGEFGFRRCRGCPFDGIRFRQSGNGSLEIFLSDDAGRGALRSPTFPRATGCERVSTLSRSPGAILVGNSVSVDTSYSGDLFTAARDSLGLWRSSFRSIRRMYPYISFDTGWVERKYGQGFGLGGDGSAGGRTSFSGGFSSDGTSHLPLVAG